MVSRPPVTLYRSAECRLCDLAISELRALEPEFSFGLEIVAIDGREELERLYGWAVPVVVFNNKEIARAPIRPGSLRVLISEALSSRIPGA